MTIRMADLFCGAGGTSHGAIQALEALGFRAELTAVNHWDIAIATHSANHPDARHLCASIDDLNPRTLFSDGLDLLWASPECTHHSVARGGRPINDQSRATAWCVTRWAEALQPQVILVENVPEFVTWGPVNAKGRPIPSKKGEIFRAWVRTLRAIGYRVDWRILCAADYGDPTTRRRLFVQAVRGRRKIVWPNPTHAPEANADLFGRVRPWRTAREIIDASLPMQVISQRKRPLSPIIVRRIKDGIRKYDRAPMIIEYYGNGRARPITDPLPTVTCRDRFALAQKSGKEILFRMLKPHELAAAQGFPADYRFEGNRTDVVRQIGNAVPCGLARALVAAVWAQRNDVADILYPPVAKEVVA